MKPLPRMLALSAALLAAGATFGADGKPPSPAAASAVSATGTWNLEIETAQGKGTPVFTFKQDGENLTGTYKGLFGEAPVTGTLKGSEIKFTVKTKRDEREMVINYSGTLEGNVMKGKVDFSGLGEATFTGKRKTD